MKLQNRNTIDIETEALPIEQIFHLKPEFNAPSNWKDPFKIAENIKEQEAKWLSDAALSPVTGHVLVLGVKPFGQAPIILEGEERDILLGWWELFNEGREFAQFIGHAIIGFDLPFIVKRSWLHQLPVPMDILFPGDGRFLNRRRFLDTMLAFQCGDTSAKYVSLDALAKFFGLEGKTEDLGPQFGEVYRTNRDRALRYFRRDLEIPEKAAQIMFPRIEEAA